MVARGEWVGYGHDRWRGMGGTVIEGASHGDKRHSKGNTVNVIVIVLYDIWR